MAVNYLTSTLNEAWILTIGRSHKSLPGEPLKLIPGEMPAKGFAGDEDKTRFTPGRLYEEFYCSRGEVETVLKQQTLDLAADRMSTHHLASNQLRLTRTPKLKKGRFAKRVVGIGIDA